MAKLIARGIVQVQSGQLLVWSADRADDEYPEWTDREAAEGRCQTAGLFGITTLVTDGVLRVSLFDDAQGAPLPHEYQRVNSCTLIVRDVVHVGPTEIAEPMLTAAWRSDEYCFTVGQFVNDVDEGAFAASEVHIFAAPVSG